MGLDIYGYIAKKTRKNGAEAPSIENLYQTLKERRIKQVNNFIQKSINALERAENDPAAYEEVYHNIFDKKIKRLTPSDWLLKKVQENVLSLPAARYFLNNEWKQFVDYPREAVYFRKVNFVYQFFSEKMEDEECYATREDIEELIHRCNVVLERPYDAPELLPTCSGCFFGSTEYDNWYFKDVRNCRRQMKALLKRYNEDEDVIFFVFSW